MSFANAVRSGFANYANFEGRSLRSEYWWWILFTILVNIGVSVVDMLLGFRPLLTAPEMDGSFTALTTFGPLETVATLALFLPTLAVAVRRLHDTDRSGWWYLLIFIPVIGMIILIVFLASAGTPGSNRYGPPPTGRAMSAGYDLPAQR